jgi:hypothetical protein
MSQQTSSTTSLKNSPHPRKLRASEMTLEEMKNQWPEWKALADKWPDNNHEHRGMRKKQWPLGIRKKLAELLEPEEFEGREPVWVGKLYPGNYFKPVIEWEHRPEHSNGSKVRLSLWRVEAPWDYAGSMINPEFPCFRPFKALVITRHTKESFIQGCKALTLAIKDKSVDKHRGLPIHSVYRRYKGYHPTVIDRFWMDKEGRVGVSRMTWRKDKQIYKEWWGIKLTPLEWVKDFEPKFREVLSRLEDKG